MRPYVVVAALCLAFTLACTGESTPEATPEQEPAAEPAPAPEPPPAADEVVCPTVDDLAAALRDSEVGGAVSWTTLTNVKCNLIWAVADCVPEGDMDAATVLFSRSAKGTWVAVEGGTGGVCESVPEGDREGLGCDE